MYRVFTPQIEHTRRIIATALMPEWVDVPVINPGQIDDTLRRYGNGLPASGMESTADLFGSIDRTAGSGSCALRQRTGLLVQFAHMDRLLPDADPGPGFYPYLAPPGIEVRLEGQGGGGDPASPAGVNGRLFVFNWYSLTDSEATPWYSVSTAEGEDPYLLYTPDGTTHLVFRFPSRLAGAGFISDADSAAPGRMLLWFEQEGPGNQPLTTKYDLVQATTILMPVSGNAENLESVVVAAPPCTGPTVGKLPVVGPLQVIDPNRTEAGSPDEPCEGCITQSPTFLNSEFCHIPPNCAPGDPCYTPDKEIRIAFTGAVRAAEGIDPPVFIRKLDGDPTFNYAPLMNITIQHLSGVGMSDKIVISGNGTTLLVPGDYEVSPILDSSGNVLSPLSDSFSPEDATPVQPFTYTFTLLSDCNLNGLPDYSEDGTMITDISINPLLDVWPYDHMIDDCHPELCQPDYNDDGTVDQGDVDTLMAMISANDYSNAAPNANPDFNHDGSADMDDVVALVDTVAGHGCPNQ